MNRTVASVAASLVLLIGFAGPAEARHRGGRGDTAFQFRVGGFFPGGDSDFWKDTEDTFTLDHSDFDEVIVGFSVVGSFGNRLEAAFNADFYESTVLSAVAPKDEFGVRELYVDESGLPILHDSELRMMPLTVDVRFLPAGRYRVRGQGRQVRQPVFYVGAGAGLTFWEYEEIGDFVDFTDDSIFFERYLDDGVAFEVHGVAGLELPVGDRWSLLFEGRYSWVDDRLDGDFAGLGEIDLGGASAYIGGSFRF